MRRRRLPVARRRRFVGVPRRRDSYLGVLRDRPGRPGALRDRRRRPGQRHLDDRRIGSRCGASSSAATASSSRSIRRTPTPSTPNRRTSIWAAATTRASTFAGKSAGIMEADPRPWQGVIEIDPDIASRRLRWDGSRLSQRQPDGRVEHPELRRQPRADLAAEGRRLGDPVDPSSTASAALGLAGTAQGTDNPPGTPSLSRGCCRPSRAVRADQRHDAEGPHQRRRAADGDVQLRELRQHRRGHGA